MRVRSVVPGLAAAGSLVACDFLTAPSEEERRYAQLLDAPALAVSAARDSTFAAAFAPFRQWSGLVTPGMRLPRTTESWSALWDTIQTFHSPKVAAPDVEFAQEMVVIAAMGGVGSGGYSMRIRHVTTVRDTVFVLAERVVPATDCMLTAAEEAPSDARLLPASELPVLLLTARFVRECDPFRLRPDR